MKTANHTIGFVYVLTNPFMPDLVKIGYTGLLAEDRADALFTTSVPAPFLVEYRSMTSRPRKVEFRSHALLRTQRVNKRREFFRVSVSEAIEAVRLSAVDIAGIESWEKFEPHILDVGDHLALNLEHGQSFVHIFYSDMSKLHMGRAEPLDIYQAHSNGDLLEIFVAASPSHVAGFASGDLGGTSDPVPYLDREGKAVNGMINGRETLLPGERLVWLPSPDKSNIQVPVIFEAREHCQMISRTWSPKMSPDGIPLLFNAFMHGAMPHELVQAVKNALALPIPRNWAPRQTRDSNWVDFGTEPQPPEYWLPQLKLRSRKSRRAPA